MSLASNVEWVESFHDSEYCPTCIAEREQEAEEEGDYGMDEEAHDDMSGACLCHDAFSCPDDGYFEYQEAEGW